MKLETKSKITTPLILIFGVLCLSTSAIFVKLADAPSSITAFYRLFFTFLMLAPFAVSSKSARRELAGLSGRQWGMCLISGVLLAIHYILWFESLIYTSVASSTVLVTLQPIFSILLAYFFLKDRLKRAQIVSCLIAIGGSFIIGWGDFQPFSVTEWHWLQQHLSAPTSLSVRLPEKKSALSCTLYSAISAASCFWLCMPCQNRMPFSLILEIPGCVFSDWQ